MAPATLHLKGPECHQISRVLRLKRGAEVVLLDGAGGAWQARLLEVHPDAVVAELTTPAACAPEPPIAVTHFAAVLKGDRQDWLVQKAVELGVARIQPILTERGVARAEGGKPDRWRRIAREAAEQSERAVVPAVGEPLPLREVRWEGARALACTERAGKPIGSLAGPADREIALFIGPEGGWTDAERDWLVAAGAAEASLGPRILRAETAAMAAISALMSHLAWPREQSLG